MYRILISAIMLLALSLPAQANEFTKCNKKVFTLAIKTQLVLIKEALKNCSKLDTGFDELADDASAVPNDETTDEERDAYVTANYPKSIAKILNKTQKILAKADAIAVKKGCVSYFDADSQGGDQDDKVSDEFTNDATIDTEWATSALAGTMAAGCRFAAPVDYAL